MPTSLPSAGTERERRIFLYLALAIAGWVIAGFGMFILAGISSFSSPWWVHLHAVSFIAWIILYVAQNILVVRGNHALHRKLGIVGACLAAWMVLVALLVTPATISASRVPPFFTPAEFLALDWVNILCFGGLVFAAFQLRNRPDWHKRLMLCATTCVIAPAFGRLLALAGALNPWTNFGALLLFLGVAALVDRRATGHFHPAYLWGGVAIAAIAPLVVGLAAWPTFADLANRIAH